jgi:hypothetical protein
VPLHRQLAAGSAGRPGGGAPALPEFELAFLGTGCAAPSRLRSCAGILLRAGGIAALLDAGEGSYGGLLRRFGPAADEVCRCTISRGSIDKPK